MISTTKNMIVVSLLVISIGLIIGIYYMTKSDKNTDEEQKKGKKQLFDIKSETASRGVSQYAAPVMKSSNIVEECQQYCKDDTKCKFFQINIEGRGCGLFSQEFKPDENTQKNLNFTLGVKL